MADLRTYVGKGTRTVITAVEKLSDGRVALRLKEGTSTAASVILSGAEATALGIVAPAPTTATTTTTTSSPTTAPSGWRVLWEDTFDGPAGSPWNPNIWIPRGSLEGGLSKEGFLGQCAAKDANLFLSGDGYGVCRTKRETVTVGGVTFKYTTGLAATFSYGYGPWPPTTVKQSFPSPCRVEVRVKHPQLAGGWPAVWSMAVDKTRAQGVQELDFGEVRTSLDEHQAHAHLWVNGADVKAWDSARIPVDLQAFNTYGLEINAAGQTTFSINGQTMPGPTVAAARHGIIAGGGIGNSGSWGANYANPAGPSDAGPWDSVFDFVRVLVPA